MVAVHEYTHESISIVKTESWDVTGAVMLVHFEVTNDGADDITDLTLVWEFDPDQDQDESEGGGLSVDPGVSTITLTDPTQDTNNDVQDPDGDGVAEWVQSVGDESGYAAGFLACDDCDDWDDAVNPSVAETWYDGVDQDCAGEDGGGADTAGDVDEDEDDDDGDKTGCSTAPGGGSFGLALLGGLGLVGLRRRQRG
jgi:MYXO-CTERM domain-containing protein